MKIRHTQTEDIDALRALIVETWHDTYDGTIGAERVNEITRKWHSANRLTAELAAENCVSLVAGDHNGRLIGHALIRLQAGDTTCLARLYVLPDAQGSGVGTALLNRALREAHGQARMVLEVEKANTKARAFYERHGFAVSARKANCGDQDGVPTLDMERQV